MPDLTPLGPFGDTAPRKLAFGPVTLSEIAGLALLSVAPGAGARWPAPFGLTEPGVAGVTQADATCAFWCGPGQWMLACPDTVPPPALPGCAVTDQSDGWLICDLTSDDPALLERVLEKLVNLDPLALAPGRVQRTGLAHLSAFVLRLGPGQVRVLGPRSAAGSLWDALARAAARACAPLHT